MAQAEPADEGAERVVLGAMMLSRVAAGEVLDMLDEGDFYRSAHATIFRAVRGLFAAGEPTDPIVLATVLAAGGDLERAGGRVYLAECLEAVPTAANAGYYAAMVRDLSIRRRVREAGVRLIQRADDPVVGLDALCSAAQEDVFAATAPRHRAATVSFSQGLAATLDAIEAAGRSTGLPGLPTWLGALNAMTGGLRPGQLVIVAGRPGMGKSVLGFDEVRLVGLRHRKGCQVFSLEMTREEIFKRMIAAELNIPFDRIRDGRLGQSEWDHIMHWAGETAGAPIWVDDNSAVDMAYIRTVSRQRAVRDPLALIFVDYLQLMSSSGRRDNRQQEVADISRGLKLLAKELDCVVVAASQLNRGPEQRADKRPYLADLRESGAVEQDADIVILLHRPDYYDEHDRPREADLIVAKQRNGPTGDVVAMADLTYMRFRDFDPV